MTGTETLLLRLFKPVRFESNAATFVEDLVDLAGTARPFKVVHNHVPFVAKETLTTFGMS